MTEVASFMRMYPAYKLKDILNEYAITFFALLNEGYRLRAVDNITNAQISDLPSMNRDARIKFYRALEWAATHPSDILKPSGQGSSPAEIKKIFEG